MATKHTFQTVGELIAHLQTYPPETPVKIVADVSEMGARFSDTHPLNICRFKDGAVILGTSGQNYAL